MLYLTTLKAVGEIPALNDEDILNIFCKETDTMKASEVNILLKLPGTIEFVTVNGRDDVLVMLGEIMPTCTPNECIVLDPSIPIPARYADRMKYAKTKKAVQRKPRTKKQPVKQETPQEQEVQPVQEDKEPTVTAAVKEEDISFEDHKAAELYQMIGIKSEDIGFSWDTEMLMQKLIGYAEQASSDEDIVNSIKQMNGGDKILKAMNGDVTKLKELAKR